MMEVFVWYMLFATATGITAVYELLHPVVMSHKKPVENIIVIYITFLVLTVLVAPLVFLSCIVPSMGERFRETLEKTLFEEQEIQT